MDEALKINKIILILIAGILFISSNSMPLANDLPLMFLLHHKGKNVQ